MSGELTQRHSVTSGYQTFKIFRSQLVCFLVFLVCVVCVFVLFYVLFLLLYTAVSFLFLYKFTDHCHRVETLLR